MLLIDDRVISYAEAVPLYDSSVYCIPRGKYESWITDRKMQMNPLIFFLLLCSKQTNFLIFLLTVKPIGNKLYQIKLRNLCIL